MFNNSTVGNQIFPVYIYWTKKVIAMAISKSAARLRKLIEKAIEDHKLTREEMDEIINTAAADSHIDKHELALLDQLNQMIENREVKITK